MKNKKETNDKIRLKKKLFKLNLISYIFGAFLCVFYFCLINIIRTACSGWVELFFNFFILSIFFGFIWWICEDDRFDK